jgi:multimeric flavodoxin WrbA
MKVLVVFYSMYGHCHKMAEAVAQGVLDVSGAQAELFRVPETLPEEVLKRMGALDAQKAFAHIPVCQVEELATADAIIFGTPTRFGNMCGQMPAHSMAGRKPRSRVFTLRFCTTGWSSSACHTPFRGRCPWTR